MYCRGNRSGGGLPLQFLLMKQNIRLVVKVFHETAQSAKLCQNPEVGFGGNALAEASLSDERRHGNAAGVCFRSDMFPFASVNLTVVFIFRSS